MIRFCCLLLMTLVLRAQELRLQVLGTTDTHSHVTAQDSFTMKLQAKGWEKVATLIRQAKLRQPRTLLVDAGDTIQGEPMAYVRHRVKPELGDPSMAIMNALGFHAMAVGNHDFDFGLPTLRAVEEQAQFPWLSANAVEATTGRPAFTGYSMQEFDGVRVAVLGLSSSATARLADRDSMGGLTFRDAVEVAKEMIPRLRTVEKADVVVVVYHGGIGNGGGKGAEHQGRALAEQVPGIDLLLLGHSHQTVQTTVNGVTVLQPGAQGRALAQAEIALRREKGRWKVQEVTGKVVPVTEDVPSDEEVLRLTKALREETDRYLDTFATTLETELDGRWSRMEDSALVQLLHRVQHRATGAKLSAVASPGSWIFIPKGPTSVRQFYALMPYENRVVTIRITGAQLKAYLEHAARFFNAAYLPDLFNKDVAGHDYDMVNGCTYTLDLMKPVGQRVLNLKVDGRPVTADQGFTMAISSYRLGDGGGYMTAIGFKGQPEKVSSELLRNLLLEQVLSHPTLNVGAEGNWRTSPYLDRERVLAQQPR